MAQLRKNPTVRNLVTVTFARDEFLKRLDTDGLAHPTATYRMFDAEMDVDGKGALKPIDAAFDLRDSRFSPAGSQEEPELSDIRFDDGTAQLFGCENMMGLSIQRVDLLQRAVGEFHRLAQSDGLESVAKAKTGHGHHQFHIRSGIDRIGTAGHQRADRRRRHARLLIRTGTIPR